MRECIIGTILTFSLTKASTQEDRVRFATGIGMITKLDTLFI